MSGHGTRPAQARTGTRTGTGRLRWAMVGAVGVFTLGLFGAAANADEVGRGDDSRAAAPTTEAPDDITTDSTGSDGAPTPPSGLGTDAELDALAQQCFEGDLLACDHLFLQSPVGSDYEQYGDTCAGRQQAGTESFCGLGSNGDGPIEPGDPTETTEVASGEPVPPENLGSDPELDALATECYVGDMEACDDLYGQSSEGSEYRTYGDTCAGRQPELTGRLCTSLENPVPGTGPASTVPGTTAGPTVPPVTSAGQIPPPSLEPVGLGNDPALDALAQGCYVGDMAACDDLYNESEPETDYRHYGDTCAGRQPEDTGTWCRSAFGGTPSTDVPGPVTTVAAPLPPVTTVPVAPTPSTVGIPTVPVPTAPVPTVPAPTVPAPTVPAPTVPVPTVPVPTAPGPVPTVPFPSLPVPTAPAPGATTLPISTVPGAIPPPTMQPTGLGTNPTLDALAQSCYDGDMAACDELYRESDDQTDPLYREFADTCAGRQPAGSGRWCEAAFPATGEPTTVPGVTVPTTVPGDTVPTTGVVVTGIPPATQQPAGLGTDATLDALAQRCFDGDMQACDDLFLQSELGTPYHAYGDTCAGRQGAGTYTYCHIAFPATQP